MGCYDTIWFDCPHCGQQINVQTKAGVCDFNDWYIFEAPPRPAAAMHNKTGTCDSCNKDWKIRVQVVTHVLPDIEVINGN